MSIYNLTNTNLINLDLQAKDKREAILILSEMLKKDDKLVSKEAFYMDVITREKESTTGFGNGFALPHGKSKCVKEPCFAIGKSRKGIEWKSMDGKLVNFIILLAVPSEEAGTTHLKILSEIAENLNHEGFMDKLMKADNKEEILNILQVI